MWIRSAKVCASVAPANRYKAHDSRASIRSCDGSPLTRRRLASLSFALIESWKRKTRFSHPSFLSKTKCRETRWPLWPSPCFLWATPCTSKDGRKSFLLNTDDTQFVHTTAPFLFAQFWLLTLGYRIHHFRDRHVWKYCGHCCPKD